MLFEFLAAISAAFSFAGLALLLRFLSGKRIPKWVVPAAAGLGMISYTIWSEYSWFERIVPELPENLAIVDVIQTPSPFSPWTYVFPVIKGFIAADLSQIGIHPTNDNLRLVTVYRFGRWSPPSETHLAFDCAAKKRVLIGGTTAINADGVLENGVWQDIASGDPLADYACRPLTKS